MKIKDIYVTKGYSGYYNDDQAAIRAGAKRDFLIYRGTPLIIGHQQIRQAGECLSINIVLDNNIIVTGDCVSVQYSGVSGREDLLRVDEQACFLEEALKPVLLDMKLDNLIQSLQEVEKLKFEGFSNTIQYGISQAVLGAVSIKKNKTKMEVICDDYSLPLIAKPIQLFGQSGEMNQYNVDKMILKEVDVLPHGLINNEEKFGKSGEKFIDYIVWVVQRVKTLKVRSNYNPCLHFDLYGLAGLKFDMKIDSICDYLLKLENFIGDHQLYIETPVIAENTSSQIQVLKKIYEHIASRTSKIKIVADEWCNTVSDVKAFVDAKCCHMIQIKTPDLGNIMNTIDAVMYCNEHNVESYLGGSCNETDVTAHHCTHIALATRPTRMLVKPGMDFDVGYTIVFNEIRRIINYLMKKADKDWNY